jgi:hypothetical protein
MIEFLHSSINLKISAEVEVSGSSFLKRNYLFVYFNQEYILRKVEVPYVMHDNRRHKRFQSDSMELNGKMIMAQKVEIIDISLGGVALKTDKRLNVGREYLIKLGIKGESIDMKGTIIRCELSNIEEGSDGESVSIYSAGIMFKDIPSAIDDSCIRQKLYGSGVHHRGEI